MVTIEGNTNVNSYAQLLNYISAIKEQNSDTKKVKMIIEYNDTVLRLMLTEKITKKDAKNALIGINENIKDLNNTSQLLFDIS